MNRADFQKLAEIRLEEAATLLNAGKFDGAYYLSGYAVECGLKACIAKQTKAGIFRRTERLWIPATHTTSGNYCWLLR